LGRNKKMGRDWSSAATVTAIRTVAWLTTPAFAQVAGAPNANQASPDETSTAITEDIVVTARRRAN